MSSNISQEPRQHPVTGEATTFGQDSADEEEWGDQEDSSTYKLSQPGPSDDPFKVLLEPLLDRDTKQCDAWKDEVQNILIFAGLFSAVVTAFVLASYQKLQPDPNDQIIALLSRIADQMNSPTGNTSSHDATSSVFIPASSDIRVNIFWFISLVLSLTVALIGIITLQWLREHQLYESGISASKIIAILNARSDGLKRWYVPQIFAALPLLLQTALVLFFAGLVEFLSAIRIEVAIPVILALAIPILFVVVTTILPTLQLFAIHFPHLLSMNYSPPAPCPYKSPQALIFQRGAVISGALFRLFARVFAVLWIPFVSIARVFAKSDKPFRGQSAPFSTDNYQLQLFHRDLRKAAGNWISMDMAWLGTRTCYAFAIQKPLGPRRFGYGGGDIRSKLAGIIGFYDRIQSIQNIASNPEPSSDAYSSTVSTCMQTVVLDLSTAWKDHPRNQPSRGDPQARFTALMRTISSYSPPHRIHLQEDIFLPELMDQAFVYLGSVLGINHPFTREWLETRMMITRLYLFHNAQELFLCSDPYRPGIIPSLFYQALEKRGNYLEPNPSWMKYMSRRWTRTLKNVIVDARMMIPVQKSTDHCYGPSPSRCGNNLHTGLIRHLTMYVVLFQVSDDIRDTLRLLHNHSTSSTPPYEDRPHVLIIACAYIDAVVWADQHKVVDIEFRTLLDAICSRASHLSPELSEPHSEWRQSWPGYESALAWIRQNQAAKHLKGNATTPISVRSLTAPSVVSV